MWENKFICVCYSPTATQGIVFYLYILCVLLFVFVWIYLLWLSFVNQFIFTDNAIIFQNIWNTNHVYNGVGIGKYIHRSLNLTCSKCYQNIKCSCSVWVLNIFMNMHFKFYCQPMIWFLQSVFNPKRVKFLEFVNQPKPSCQQNI